MGNRTDSSRAIGWAAAAATVGVGFLLDRPLAGLAVAVESGGVPALGTVAHVAEWASSAPGLLLVVLAVTIAGGRRRGAVLILAIVLPATVAATLKLGLGRERPHREGQRPGNERTVFNGPGVGIREPASQSFPSGHATAAFAAATAVSGWYPAVAVPAYAVATATGVSRVVEREHFASDVVAGGVLGHALAAWIVGLPWVRRVAGPAGRPRRNPGSRPERPR